MQATNTSFFNLYAMPSEIKSEIKNDKLVECLFEKSKQNQVSHLEYIKMIEKPHILD